MGMNELKMSQTEEYPKSKLKQTVEK